MASRQTLWDQLVDVGTAVAARLSNQERAVSNARGATTEMSRARVERDAVELYLADHEEQRLADETGPCQDVLTSRRDEAN